MEENDLRLQHELNSVLGWIELQNYQEAEAELAAILQSHPDNYQALDLKWQLIVLQREWPTALELANKLVEMDPGNPVGYLHQSYATRRVAQGGGLEAARRILLQAWRQFPNVPLIAYNLACYASVLGETTEARSFLDRAVQLADKKAIQSMALQDPDLKPLWPEIKKW